MRKGNKKRGSAGAVGGYAGTAVMPSRPQPTGIATAIAPSAQVQPSAGRPRPTSLYFVNAFVDYAVIGGLSIAVYLLLIFGNFYFGIANERWAAGITLAAMLGWVCNWPHFSATSYRLYHSTGNIMQYPLTALVVPWFILAGMIGAILSPSVIAPYLVKLFFWWSAYHFCGQTFGITMIYARRAGFAVGRWERLGLNTFIYCSFLVSSSASEVAGKGPFDFYGIQYIALGLPAYVPQVFHVLMWVGGALFLSCAVRWMTLKKRLLPPIVLVPAAAQYIWFVLGAGWFSFNEFVPFFHCMQYLLIAWSMQLKEKMDLQNIAPSTTYVVGESLRWGFLNVVGGALLFFVFPLLTWAVREQVSPANFLTAARDLFTHPGAPNTPGLPFYIGITIVAVQIHHFFVDGVIWKLKRKSVSSPLMVNLSDMLEPAHAG
jgi:hypothetical protein